MKIRLLIAGFLFCTALNAQEVEVVIASGLDYAQSVAISPDSRYVAKTIMNSVSIWDVKTGRMIRNAQYTEDLQVTADSMWFSGDSKTLIIALLMTNDQYHINVESGKSEKIIGPPMDWANYKYVMSNISSSSAYLYGPDNKDLVYLSPDKKKELIYRKVKSPYHNSELVPFVFQVLLKSNGSTTQVLDTAMAASFAFSPDSRYLFADQSIYDLEANRKVTDLKTVPYSGKSVMFIPGTHIPLTVGINNLRQWEFPDIKDIALKGAVNFRASADGWILVCESYDLNGRRTFASVDLRTGEVKPTGVETGETGYILDVSPDGNYFCYLDMEKVAGAVSVRYSVKIHDTKTGKLIKTVKNTSKAYFTADNNFMITDSSGMGSVKYNLSNGKATRFPTEGVTYSTFITGISADHAYVLGTATEPDENNVYHSRVNAWNAASGEKVFDAEVSGIMITGMQVSNDHKFISLCNSHENAILVYNFETGEKIHELKGHTSMIEITMFSDDSKRLISSSLDGTRRVWNLEKGTEMVSLISTGENDYAIVNPKKYYYATKGAQKLIHFVKGAEIFPFAQFDLKYNRPDIIIESLEAWNQSLVEPFNLAYQKRLARLGFTEEMLDGDFHLPTISLVDEEKIPITTKSGTLSLSIAASDDRFVLDRMMIRINEVPVNGTGGLSLRDRNINSFGETVDVQLSTGRNNIAVTVMNEKGVESIAANLSIEYVPENYKKPNLHLITIGVSDYSQSNYNLNFASKDANDLHLLLSKPGAVFGEVFTHHLVDKEVTLKSIVDLKTRLLNTSVDDAVCIFYAGHGVLDQDLNYFLASHDMDFNKPSEKGIAYEVVEGLVSDIPARHKLILIDACHSGEIDKENVVLVENTTVETGDELTFRAITSTTVQQVGLTNSFELMKELFTDVKKSSGTMIISSAGGMEYAIEGEQWNNGVFTYCVLNGITHGQADLNRDGSVMLSELNEYVRDAVYEITAGRQQPTTRAEVTDSDWRLW